MSNARSEASVAGGTCSAIGRAAAARLVGPVGTGYVNERRIDATFIRVGLVLDRFEHGDEMVFKLREVGVRMFWARRPGERRS